MIQWSPRNIWPLPRCKSFTFDAWCAYIDMTFLLGVAHIWNHRWRKIGRPERTMGSSVRHHSTDGIHVWVCLFCLVLSIYLWIHILRVDNKTTQYFLQTTSSLKLPAIRTCACAGPCHFLRALTGSIGKWVSFEPFVICLSTDRLILLDRNRILAHCLFYLQVSISGIFRIYSFADLGIL